jgi:hypothetical protein
MLSLSQQLQIEFNHICLLSVFSIAATQRIIKASKGEFYESMLHHARLINQIVCVAPLRPL